MIQVRNTSKGFTLVELTLSMTFISVLLLGIALLTLQISTIYNKGMTVRAVNEMGQLVSSDIQRELNVSTVTTVKKVGDAGGGRLCAGLTVYAWNFGGKLTKSAGGFNQFTSGLGPAVDNPIRLVKFPSGGQDYCTQVAGNYPGVPTSATDLLSEGDVELAVSAFDFSQSDIDGDGSGSQKIYTMGVTIGSGDGNLASNVNGCTAPTNVDDSYCAINKFSFTARAGSVNE